MVNRNNRMKKRSTRSTIILLQRFSKEKLGGLQEP
jgi:hypothetical protein